MMHRLRFLLAATILATACGGEKPEAKSGPNTDPAPPVPTVQDAGASKMSDTMKPAPTDSGTKKAMGPLRDSAVGPKFTVDSAGKVTPIKKKP